MRRFLALRLAGMVGVLLVASVVVYCSIYLSPGSPEDVLFGARPPSPAVRANVRHFLGLDENPALRYFHWLGNVLSGNLGTSLITLQPVTDRIGHPLLITLALVGYAGVLVLLLGIGLGLLSALRPGLVDAVITAFTSAATALPAFVASTIAIAVFSVRLGWFPSYGLGSGNWFVPLTLPAFSLAIISSGLVARVTRATTRLQLASEQVQTAQARGIGRARIIRSHVLRNSAAPIVTVSGLQIAGLFAGAVVVEQAFGLGGIGELLISSVQQKDYPVVQAISLIIVLAFAVCNLAADVIAALLDPRALRAVTA